MQTMQEPVSLIIFFICLSRLTRLLVSMCVRVLGFEPRAFWLEARRSTLELHPQKKLRRTEPAIRTAPGGAVWDSNPCLRGATEW